MASHNICLICLRTLRQQLRQSQHGRSSLLDRASTSRRISLSPLLLSAQAAAEARPQPSSPPKTPEPSSKKVEQIPKPSPPPSAGFNIAAKVRQHASATTETYIAYGACETLVKECARQADYTIPQVAGKGASPPTTKDGEHLGVGKGWWYEKLDLSPTFNIWAQVTFLHMYVLTVRMRAFPATHAPSWHQHLLDHFFHTAEDRMVQLHGIHARAVRNKYLKDLFVRWRGLLAAYDEGVAKKNDAVLAAAVWRNLFRGDEDVDLRHLGTVVSYLRGVLKGLEGMEDEGVARGEVVFGDPESQREGVLVRSRMMDRVRSD